MIKHHASFLFALLGLSCNQVLGIEETTLVTSQPAKTGPWRCVTGQTPPKPSSIPETITLSMRATNLENNLQVGQPGVRFQVCNNRNNPKCDTPDDDQTSGEDGNVSLKAKTFGQGFNGFVKITDARNLPDDKAAERFVTFHYFFSNTLYADLQVPSSIMISYGGLEFLVKELAKIPLPEGATEVGVNHISATPLDCDGGLASGVSFSITPSGGAKAVPWYFNNELPSPNAKATDGTGPGGSFFLDTGVYRVEATTEGEGIVSAADSIVLAPNAFSTVLMLPR